MSNIVKLRLEEKIRFLLLRFSNNLDRVAEEASKYAGTNIPVEVVAKISKKFREKQDKDIKFWVACSMAQEVLRGAMERQAKLEAMYQCWDGKEEDWASSCCSAPVQEYVPNGGTGVPYYRCLQCENTCNRIRKNHLELEHLKLRILNDMRRESTFLVKAAKDLGFVTEKDPTPVTNNKNFILVNNQANQESPQPIPIDAEAAKRVENMSPAEREKLIRKLDKMVDNVTDTEFLDSKEEESNSNEGK